MCVLTVKLRLTIWLNSTRRNIAKRIIPSIRCVKRVTQISCWNFFPFFQISSSSSSSSSTELLLLLLSVGACWIVSDYLILSLMYFLSTHTKTFQTVQRNAFFFFFSLNNIIMNVIIWVTFHYNLSVWRHSSSLSLVFFSRSFSIYSLSLARSFAHRPMRIALGKSDRHIKHYNIWESKIIKH